MLLWLSNVVVHIRKCIIRIQAPPPKAHFLLDYVEEIKTLLAFAPIEILLVSHVNQSSVFPVKQSLVSHLFVAL